MIEQIAGIFDALGKGYVGGIIFMLVVIGIYLFIGSRHD